MTAHRADLQWVPLGDGRVVALGTAGARLLARVLDGLLIGIPTSWSCSRCSASRTA